jgi:eukaryotic-like serine/threonine-protein kinase
MDILDPALFRQQAIKLKLVTPEQLDEVCEELGARNPPLQELLRGLERKGYLTPWQSTKLVKGETGGFFLGGYRILYKISSGSFGRVFRAEDSISGRIVAIKVLRRRWSDKPERIDLFAREGKVGLQLKHDNIVEVLAISHDLATDQHYIVMEFVEGGNLREILQIRKKLSAAEALKIIEDATAGLAYAYSRGVTHRDVKLTNILISSQGIAKLVDFGLAQFYADSSKEREKHRVERTVDYAGLEKTTGVKPGDVRSDIFFLGCVLFEMLTGRPPIVTTRDKSARMAMQRFQQIPPLPTDEVQAPPLVFMLVDKMLSLDPQLRFQTPSQLLDAIRSARREVEGKNGEAAPPRSLFIVESDVHLQDKLREEFKRRGFRVLMSADPLRALDRYRQQPFDALIVDAESSGDDGRLVFQQILLEALHKQLACAGILILGKDQANWVERLEPMKRAAVLVRPGVTLKQVIKKLNELLGTE